MSTVPGYTHRIAAHCESGSVRNLLCHAGADVSEALVFGIGSGPFFAYIPFVKIMSVLPLIAIRLPIGAIVDNVAKTCGVRFFRKEFETTKEALAKADELLAAGTPVAASVDMFYMKYLPTFLQVHTPAHFIVLVGRDGDRYAVSDPYIEKIGELGRDDLVRAMCTNAPLSKRNLLVHVEGLPKALDLRKAIVAGMRRTVKNMLLPPVVRRIVFIVGIEGIRTFAARLEGWPGRFRGLELREAILYLACVFEEQGTGGGAFRLMEGAFLREAAGIFGSDALRELAARMIENGREWREASRELVKIGKTIPLRNEEFDDWFARSRAGLVGSLRATGELYRKRADAEKRLLQDMGRVAASLKT